jgi:hypothetical protein
MAPVLAEYFATGLVSRMPTWVMSMALMMISFMMFTAGVILDSVARSRAEQLRIHYMSLEAPHLGNDVFASEVEDIDLQRQQAPRAGAA